MGSRQRNNIHDTVFSTLLSSFLWTYHTNRCLLELVSDEWNSKTCIRGSICFDLGCIIHYVNPIHGFHISLWLNTDSHSMGVIIYMQWWSSCSILLCGLHKLQKMWHAHAHQAWHTDKEFTDRILRSVTWHALTNQKPILSPPDFSRCRYDFFF